MIIVILIYRKNRQEREYVKTIREFLITLCVVSFIVSVTGTLLEGITRRIGQRKDIYAVYPALIDTAGDVGSIVGCTATTKLVLGTLSPSFSGMKGHSKNVFLSWLASLIMFGVYSLMSSLFFGMDKFWGLLIQLTLLNVMVMPVVIFISLLIAIYTSKKGWNPDNFIIPIESALSDGITTIAILILIILGVV